MVKLSQADRDFLAEFRKRESPDNPFAGGEPAEMVNPAPDSPPKTSTSSARVELKSTAVPLELYQGELPTGLKDPGDPVPSLRPGGFAVAETNAYDEPSLPVLLDAKTGLVAMSIGRHQSGKPQEAHGRIFVGKLPQGPAKVVHDVAEGVILLDHHVALDRSVLVSGFDGFKRGGDLVILADLAAGKPHEIHRCKIPGVDTPGFKPQVEWARILDGQHVVAVVNDQLNVWNYTSGDHVYCIDKISSQQLPALGPGRTLLAIPTGPGVTIVRALDGTSVGHISLTGSLTPGTAFHPDGSRIALCADNRVVVFNLESGQTEVDATVAEHISGTPLGWVDQHLLLAQGGTLIDTALGMGVWNYTLGALRGTVVTPGTLLVFGGFQKGVLASLPVPHPAAKDSIAKLTKAGDAIFLVRPGSTVSVDVQLIPGVDREPIVAALREAVERAGWKVADQAPVVVVAKLGRGQPQQLRFRRAGVPPIFTQPSDISEATLTPFTADLEIQKDAAVLWKRKTENFVPFSLQLDEGETVQQAVSKFERPDTEFFGRLNFPPRIPLAKVSETIGLTSLNGTQWQDLPLDIVNRVRRQ